MLTRRWLSYGWLVVVTIWCITCSRFLYAFYRWSFDVFNYSFDSVRTLCHDEFKGYLLTYLLILILHILLVRVHILTGVYVRFSFRRFVHVTSVSFCCLQFLLHCNCISVAQFCYYYKMSLNVSLVLTDDVAAMWCVFMSMRPCAGGRQTTADRAIQPTPHQKLPTT